MNALLEEFAPFLSASCTPDQVDDLVAAGYKDLYIVRDDNKVFRRMYLSHGRSITLESSLPAKAKIKTPPPLEVKETVLDTFFPGGKIPMSFLEDIEAFFREVCQVQGSAVEAHCFILWNDDRGYYIHVPEQSVTGGTVEYSYTDFPHEDCIVLDIHSHGAMGAFFSGTDDTDDRSKIYISGVIGKVNTKQSEVTFRFNMQEVKRPLQVGDIFAEPKASHKVPQEWLAKVKKRTYATPVKYGKFTNGKWEEGTTRYPYYGMGDPSYTSESDAYGQSWGDLYSGKAVGSLQSTVAAPKQESDKKTATTKSPTSESGQDERAIYLEMIKEDDTYDYIAAQKGVPQADLVAEVMSGMFALSGDDDVMLELFKTAFEAMSPRAQSKIQTNGLPF
jgi:PRTRC genetic system protein A